MPNWWLISNEDVTLLKVLLLDKEYDEIQHILDTSLNTTSEVPDDFKDARIEELEMVLRELLRYGFQWDTTMIAFDKKICKYCGGDSTSSQFDQHYPHCLWLKSNKILKDNA